MKTTKQLFVIIALFYSAVHAFAIEGLTLTIQNRTNAVLTWPSIEGASYIVQCRASLNTNDTWQTLTNYYPAFLGTNETTFIHVDAVCYPPISEGGGGGGGGQPPIIEGFSSSGSTQSQGGSYPPLPPSPWDSSNSQNSQNNENFSSLDSESFDGGGSGTNFCAGFYRVVRHGVEIAESTIANLTNGVLSGTMPVAFEAGHDLGKIASADLIIDGVKYAGDGVLPSPNAYPWLFQFDTAFLENGEHALQVKVSWEDYGTQNNFSAVSDPVYINVTNEVYYPHWEPAVGEGTNIAVFFLKTIDPDLAYEINIYNTNNVYLQTLIGQATNGVIETFWDLADTNNVIHNNPDIDTEFIATVTYTTGQSFTSSTKALPAKIQKKSDWPAQGKWVISYQDYFKHYYSQNDAMKNSIDQFAFMAAAWGGYYLYFPQPGQTNDIGQTYPIRFDDLNHPNTNITTAAIDLDHAMLTSMLAHTNSRNFIYAGHGSGSTIAGGFPSSDVKSAVKHRYRFVFLSGCDTATGDWDKAFGINGPGRFVLDYYKKIGKRPAAFMGYDRQVPFAIAQEVTVGGVTYDGTIPWQVPGFLTDFIFYWHSFNRPLNNAVSSAKSGKPALGGWVPGDNLQIYGYDDLRVNEFNYGSDWPIP